MPARMMQARDDYWTDLDDGRGPVYIKRGQSFPADHPLVAAYREIYVEVEQEEAPAEKRRGRPKLSEGAV